MAKPPTPPQPPKLPQAQEAKPKPIVAAVRWEHPLAIAGKSVQFVEPSSINGLTLEENDRGVVILFDGKPSFLIPWGQVQQVHYA